MIYFDMDEVVSDLNGYANTVNGTSLKNGDKMEEHHWNELRVNHQRLFRVLSPHTEFIRRVIIEPNRTDFAMLTALPFDDKSNWRHAPMDKILWAQKHIRQGTQVFFGPYGHDKKNHCAMGDILIDDNAQNCIDWRTHGGLAHEYKGNVDECLYWIKEMT